MVKDAGILAHIYMRISVIHTHVHTALLECLRPLTSGINVTLESDPITNYLNRVQQYGSKNHINFPEMYYNKI